MLEEILANKRQEVEAAKARLPLAELKARVGHHRAERDFRRAVTQPGRLSLIAELKRKSPSRGMLRERFDPVSLAQILQANGASALSVLTDERYFGGHLEFLRDVKQFTEIPVLRKDFVLEPYQVYEAALYQADAVLLIMTVLDDATLTECLRVAQSLELAALVEVHAEAELDRALRAGAQLIGINARDLKTFTLHANVVARLVPRIPKDRTIIAESGLQSPEDLRRLRQLGVHAALIGEALMVAPDPAAKVRELLHYA